MGYDTKISSNAREQLEQFLGVFYKLAGKGAVLIEGAKWCGKTTTELPR